MTQVVVAFGQEIVRAPTVGAALVELFGQDPGVNPVTPDAGAPPPAGGEGTTTTQPPD